jgi:hypothetical protein
MKTGIKFLFAIGLVAVGLSSGSPAQAQTNCEEQLQACENTCYTEYIEYYAPDSAWLAACDNACAAQYEECIG